MVPRRIVQLAAIAVIAALGALLAACSSGHDRLPPGGSSGSNITEVTRNDVLLRVSLIEQALNSEEPRRMSDQFGSAVEVGPDVRSRFRIDGDTEAAPVEFFREVFEDNSNFQVTMQVESVEIEGSVAVAEVRFVSSTTYIRSVPPTTRLADAVDELVFTVEDEDLLLTVWRERDPPTVD